MANKLWQNSSILKLKDNTLFYNIKQSPLKFGYIADKSIWYLIYTKSRSDYPKPDFLLVFLNNAYFHSLQNCTQVKGSLFGLRPILTAESSLKIFFLILLLKFFSFRYLCEPLWFLWFLWDLCGHAEKRLDKSNFKIYDLINWGNL